MNWDVSYCPASLQEFPTTGTIFNFELLMMFLANMIPFHIFGRQRLCLLLVQGRWGIGGTGE